MSATKLLFAGADEYMETFRQAAGSLPEITLLPYQPGLDLRGISYLMLWRPVPGLIAVLPDLKAVFCFGAGVDRLLANPDLPPDIPIVRMVEPGLTQGMIEFVLWQVLRHHRRIWELEEAQAEGSWSPHWYPPAWERRVGILGLGALGSAAAEKLAEFGFQLRGWSQSRKALAGIQSFAGAAELPDFLGGLDILVCLLPLTAETEGVLNSTLFAQLKQGASLINAGRGGHLVEADLEQALESGQLAAASLDVFSQEPLPPTHPFWKNRRIFMTPHNASDTGPVSGLAEIARQIARAGQGLPLEHVVDRSRGY